MVFSNTRLLLGSLIWSSVFICLSLGLPSQESFLGFNLDKFPSDEKQVLGLFRLWMNYHGKIYTTYEEGEHRYKIFQRNLKHITDSNAKRSSSNSLSDYRLGLNKFSDMSSEEFRDMYLRQIEMPAAAAAAITSTETNTKGKKFSCAAPHSMDWRKKGVVTPVKNQNKCGSCWAFAATGAMESINAIKTGKLISLSEQELIDCDHISQGCVNGWSSSAFEWVTRNGGISQESDYPYQSKNGTCKSKKHNGDRDVKINGYTKVAPSENSLLCAAAKQPITVSLNATDFQLYHRGIYDGDNCPKDSTNTNHIALIVGYGSKGGKDYWIVKNSWGENWGMNGYVFIQRNTKLPYGVCSINAWAYHPNKY